MDDIQALTIQLARDPSSLVFLPLAETLRRRGQLEAALTVAIQGATRYPEMAGAWDLVARIRSDRGEGDLAFDAWTTVIRLDGEHLGAHKGLGFLAYRSGDHRRSLRYLQRAVELAPEDAAARAALERVREAAGAHEVHGFPEPTIDPLTALEPDPGSAVLVDREGRLLAGGVRTSGGEDVGDALAAALAGVSREAERATRLLGLGGWTRIGVEGDGTNVEIRTPTPDTVLLMFRGSRVPSGRLILLADRAEQESRRWLEELR
jgi:tetratricopeptide (TPR) repeat protein